MTRFLLIFAALSLMVVAAAAQSQTPPDHTMSLTVQVVNGTPNGSSVAGMEVSLHLYRNEQLLDMLKRQAGDDGICTFTDIPFYSDLQLQARVEHQGVAFWSDRLGARPRAQFSTVLHVYDVSHDLSPLSLSTYHWIIKKSNEGLLISEYAGLHNPTDRALQSDQLDNQGRPQTLTFNLQAGYENFTVSEFLVQDALVFTPNGFYDPMAIPPGRHEIIFSYTLPAKSDSMTLKKTLTLPTKDFSVFVTLPDVQVNGLAVAAQNMALADGTSSAYYYLGQQDRGASIEMTLSGIAAPAKQLPAWAILGIVFGVIVIVVVLRTRKAGSGSCCDGK